MQVTFTYPAPAGDRFQPGCFHVGSPAEVSVPGKPVALGIIAAATVQADGTTAQLTVDVPDSSPFAHAIAAAYAGPGPYTVNTDGTVTRNTDLQQGRTSQ